MKNGGLKKSKRRDKRRRAARRRCFCASLRRSAPDVFHGSTIQNADTYDTLVHGLQIFSKLRLKVSLFLRCALAERDSTTLYLSTIPGISYESYPLNDLVKICRSSLWISWLPTRRSRT